MLPWSGVLICNVLMTFLWLTDRRDGDRQRAGDGVRVEDGKVGGSPGRPGTDTAPRGRSAAEPAP